VRRRLAEIAHVRSGDKGDTCNIGVIARTPWAYEVLRREVTPDRVAAHFGEMVRGPVTVYELDNLAALNVVLERALGGGATRTLRFDQTGKAMGNLLQRMWIEVDPPPHR
jgi:hypothetical protein